MSERCIWPLLNGPCPNDAWSAGLCREHSCHNAGVVLKRLQAEATEAKNKLAVAEVRAAALEIAHDREEIAHDRERTGRLQAEARVAELEAALTWSTWLGPNTPPRGITEERKNQLVAEATANHRARVAEVPDDVCPDCREDGANCTCPPDGPMWGPERPEQTKPVVGTVGDDLTRGEVLETPLQAALRASVEAAEKRGERRG